MSNTTVYVQGRLTGATDGNGFVEVEFHDLDTGNGYYCAFVPPGAVWPHTPRTGPKCHVCQDAGESCHVCERNYRR